MLIKTWTSPNNKVNTANSQNLHWEFDLSGRTRRFHLIDIDDNSEMKGLNICRHVNNYLSIPVAENLILSDTNTISALIFTGFTYTMITQTALTYVTVKHNICRDGQINKFTIFRLSNSFVTALGLCFPVVFHAKITLDKHLPFQRNHTVPSFKPKARQQVIYPKSKKRNNESESWKVVAYSAVSGGGFWPSFKHLLLIVRLRFKSYGTK